MSMSLSNGLDRERVRSRLPHNTPSSSQLPQRQFIEAMQQAGIMFHEDPIPDGSLHRFRIGEKKQQDGWYVFYGLAGAFGDWRRGIHEKWSLSQERLSDQEKKRLREQIESSQRIIKEERVHREFEAADFALKKWGQCCEEGNSPYLERKRVESLGVRFDSGDLVIPLRDTDEKLWSLQWIKPDGDKRFLKGGRKKGCFHYMGSLLDGQPIIITEGYATGASVYMAAEVSTVISFDVGNLDPVVEELRKVYPLSPLIIAGDDDCWKEDNVGKRKAEAVGEKYHIPVLFPQFRNTETHPTDFNDLHFLEGLESLKSQLTPIFQAETWPDPTPLHAIKSSLLPVLPMTPDLIPEPYREWLVDVAERMQCPLDYLAVGAIVVTASLVGTGCAIRPKQKDCWTVIPNLWGGIVGAPSTLKTPALKEIIGPLEALEAKARESLEQELCAYQVSAEVYKATKENIKKIMLKAESTSDSFLLDQAKHKLLKLKEPQKPMGKRYSTNDATIEKMHELLSHNQRGILLFRDELIGLLAGWEKEGHESDRTFYLEAWNGDGSKTTDRIGRGTIHTKNLCVSILGTTQPSKLASYFQQALKGYANDGLLQRFQLLVYPDEPKEWTLIDRIPKIPARSRAYQIMTKLAEMNFLQHGADLNGSSDIPYFQFDEAAQAVFYQWLTVLEKRLRKKHETQIMIEHLTKYRKLCPSLALLFHLIHIANGKTSGAIAEECIHLSIQWCEYLESHAQRLYGNSIDIVFDSAKKLAEKIQGGAVSHRFQLREIYRKKWSFLTSKEDVYEACEILIQSGWMKQTQEMSGEKTKTYYQLNPKVLA